VQFRASVLSLMFAPKLLCHPERSGGPPTPPPTSRRTCGCFCICFSQINRSRTGACISGFPLIQPTSKTPHENWLHDQVLKGLGFSRATMAHNRLGFNP
jgi:hypothetical protein